MLGSVCLWTFCYRNPHCLEKSPEFRIGLHIDGLMLMQGLWFSIGCLALMVPARRGNSKFVAKAVFLFMLVWGFIVQPALYPAVEL